MANNRTVEVRQEVWDGLPVLCLGSGPPLVYLAPLSRDHRPPRGVERYAAIQEIRPFARERRVWWVNRRHGLQRGATMAGIAGDVARALRTRFPEPVDILGVSTGGSVALQLAADHSEVVRRLVVVAAAYRLGPIGRDAQRQVARWSVAGRSRRAAAAMMSDLGTGARSAAALRAIGWLVGPVAVGRGDPDMLTTIGAEDSFDLRDRLSEISAPTLIIGGGRDASYGADLFRQTADGLPDGRLLLYPGKGHLGTVLSRRLARDALAFLA